MAIENISGKRERKKEIPPSWFIADGSERKGIMHVSFSPEFMNIGHGKISEYMLSGDDEKVRTITGFSIKDLNDKRQSLEHGYRGKKIAPIRVELYPAA